MAEVIPVKLQIFLIVMSCIITGYVFYLVRNEVIELKYSIIWVICGLLSILISVFPQIIVFCARLLGIGLPFNFIYLFIFLFIVITLLNLTVAVSKTAVRTSKLAQEIGMLKADLSRIYRKDKL